MKKGIEGPLPDGRGYDPSGARGQGVHSVSSHQHGTPARDSTHHEPDPYWKRAHHDWRVWVGLFLMFAAIAIYVLSDNLSFSPHGRQGPPQSGAALK